VRLAGNGLRKCLLFLKKKKQKDFNFCAGRSRVGHGHAPGTSNKRIKVFCFFSSEKKTLLPFSHRKSAIRVSKNLVLLC
jgi:hypothetical protein